MKCNRERKNDFCTLYTHILILQFKHTYTLSLSTHTQIQCIQRKTALVKKRLKHKWTSAVLMFVYSMPVLIGACSQKRSYLKTLKGICIWLHMYGNSHRHKPDQNLLTKKERTLVQAVRQKNKTNKQKKTATCVPFLLSYICLFFCLYSYKQTKQEGKCKYNTITFCVSAL